MYAGNSGSPSSQIRDYIEDHPKAPTKEVMQRFGLKGPAMVYNARNALREQGIDIPPQPKFGGAVAKTNGVSQKRLFGAKSRKLSKAKLSKEERRRRTSEAMKAHYARRRTEKEASLADTPTGRTPVQQVGDIEKQIETNAKNSARGLNREGATRLGVVVPERGAILKLYNERNQMIGTLDMSQTGLRFLNPNAKIVPLKEFPYASLHALGVALEQTGQLT